MLQGIPLQEHHQQRPVKHCKVNQCKASFTVYRILVLILFPHITRPLMCLPRPMCQLQQNHPLTGLLQQNILSSSHDTTESPRKPTISTSGNKEQWEKTASTATQARRPGELRSVVAIFIHRPKPKEQEGVPFAPETGSMVMTDIVFCLSKYLESKTKQNDSLIHPTLKSMLAGNFCFHFCIGSLKTIMTTLDLPSQGTGPY